jgi:hypothetical protein
VSVFDRSARKDGTFSREDFTYDHEGDVYFCPAGKMLTSKGTLVNDSQRCSIGPASMTATPVRSSLAAGQRHLPAKVPRSIYERAREWPATSLELQKELISRHC